MSTSEGPHEPAWGGARAHPALLAPAEQRTWAVVCHLGGVFVSLLVPLAIWLVFRGRGTYLEQQAKEALNFQITLLLAYVVGWVLVLVGIGVIIGIVAWLGGIVFAIMAAVAASEGEPYRYPVSLRLVP